VLPGAEVKPVLFSAPPIPAGMTRFHRNGTGIRRNGTGVHQNGTGRGESPPRLFGGNGARTGRREAFTPPCCRCHAREPPCHWGGGGVNEVNGSGVWDHTASVVDAGGGFGYKTRRRVSCTPSRRMKGLRQRRPTGPTLPRLVSGM
jgi:hypothetical protein